MSPAPRVLARPAVYRLSGGRWRSSGVLVLGDQALFTLRLLRVPRPYSDNRGWDTPSAQVIVRIEESPFCESYLPVPGQDGVIVASPPMHRKPFPNGAFRFSVAMSIGTGSEWIGHRLVMFRVSYERGMRGIYLPGRINILRGQEPGTVLLHPPVIEQADRET